MTITLLTIRCPDDVTPERRSAGGGEFTIGRGPDNDWILSDPDRHLSKRHCALAFRAGRWELSDLSANGTFLNGSATPVGGRPAVLDNGDRFRLGAYEIEVAIEAERDVFVRPAAGLPIADDFNPFEAEDAFAQPTRPDHTPVLEDAFRPPPRPAAAIPDDWDLDLSEARPPAAPFPVPAPPTSVPPAPRAAVGDGLLAAFLRGAGMEDATIADPERTMEAMGLALRVTVAGIRETMIARASIKGEFRIEQTMIRASGNNPLKFSAGDDDALASLLGIGRRAMPAAQAIGDALRDMRLHELATMSATQTAVRALLALLAPAAIEREADKGGLALLPAQKKARAWDAYAAAHAKVAHALADDFDSVFGKNFARAYEQSLSELQNAENAT